MYNIKNITATYQLRSLPTIKKQFTDTTAYMMFPPPIHRTYNISAQAPARPSPA